MRRGELYRVPRPISKDPKRFRIFVVVSRQVLIDSRYSSVICAPVYSNREGLITEVLIGVAEGLKHDSCIRCDELVSLRKSELTNYIGSLSPVKIQELNQALKVALDIPDDFFLL
ncbi:MAG: type II toxin-antitoxin system PemK/MazF family toxin [Pyrinomonadaceae bacterium]|nr:type II toxin-antitoxin system PemK/MazF family toxin [Pyrinomonadaceae bacterium]